MTGFGRGEYATDDVLARVEISAVNRKQADINFNLPRDLNSLEPALRKQVLATVSRGRVYVHVALEPAGGAPPAASLNQELAQQIDAAFSDLSKLLGRHVIPQATDFLRVPEVFDFGAPAIDKDAAQAAIEPALTTALANLKSMREEEGRLLLDDLYLRLGTITGCVQEIEKLAATRPALHRDALLARLQELDLELDLSDERLLKELALFADRSDISEEVTRFHSHHSQFLEILGKTEPVGRQLDFLCQELNRELNTMASKANHAPLAQQVVTAKTELEKIREQVQNLE